MSKSERNHREEFRKVVEASVRYRLEAIYRKFPYLRPEIRAGKNRRSA